jgi:Tol biopolymer transport system component
LIYPIIDPKTRSDIWYAPLDSGKVDEKKAVRLLGTNAIESQGQLSPDGKWLAYLSTESGTYEVYVRSFPSGSSVWNVSNGRAEEPRWRVDGKELHFKTSTPATGQITIWAASIASDGGVGLRIGAPQRVLDARAGTAVVQGNIWAYSPHPDGKRFLINALTEADNPTVNVVTHWQQGVGANAP